MPIEDDMMPVEVSYYFDQYLMFLIQEVTQRPSVEIINFFYELAVQIAEVGAKAKLKEGGRGMRKNLVDYFPGTSIPFTMKVVGYKSSKSVKKPDGSWGDSIRIFRCDAEVGFPEGRTWMKADDLKAISEALMEKALLDAPMDHITVPQFEKPVIRSPKMYKKLMDAFLGRESEKKERKKRKKVDDGTATTQTT